MNRTSVRAMLLLLPLLVAGCASSGGGGGSPSASAGNLLSGTSWQLTSYAATGGAPATDVPTSVVVTADFAAARISGSGGCNSYSGPYTVKVASIEIGPVAATQKACPGPAGTVEAAYFKALDAATTFVVSDGTLTLSSASGRLLTYAASKPLALVGTVWDATSINNGKQAVVSLVADSKVTATFGSDGSVTGDAGCNNYNGPYTVSGSTLKIGPLASTKRACIDAAVDTQETAYLAALESATTYEIRSGVLELRDDAGALQVSYKAEPGPPLS